MSGNKDKEKDLPTLVVTAFDRVTFLIIDDDEQHLTLMESILRSTGAREVLMVSNAYGAAKILVAGDKKIDCIICDHRLEDMSGLALLQRVRAGKNPKVPRDTRFIIITGHSSAALVTAATELDVNGFVVKPAGLGTIVKAIHMAFAKQYQLKPSSLYAKVNLAGT